MTLVRPRAALLSAISLSVALPAPPAPAAERVVDGEPTPEACARYGMSNDQTLDEVTLTAQRRSPHAKAGAAVPNAPTIPPLAAPPVEHRIQEPSPPQAMSNAPTIPPLPVPPVERRFEAMPNAPFLPYETERYPAAASNPVRQVAEAPVSTFSVDVDTASYANVRRFLHEGHRPPVDAVRVEELVKAPGAARPPLNLVFLIDTSGSMRTEDRLPLARQSLNVLIGQLGRQDRVAIVAYAGSAGEVLAPTSGREKLKMRCALQSLEASGSTAGGAGLALAYDLARKNFDPKAVNRVVLMTDGDFNVGVADPSKLQDFVARHRKDGVYLSVYGFGRGNYKDMMMQALAQNGNGTAGYIDGLMEARKLFREDFARSFLPVADDVKIQVEFNPGAVSEYRLIGYETRMLNREDFNNDQVDAGEVGSGASVTALYEITPAGAKGAVDPLRYQAPPATGGRGRELAYLKIRYKLPRQATSRLITRAIGPDDRASSLAAAPSATRWAVAVAAYGQKLRQEPWLDPRFDWPQIAQLADSARGADPFGLRAEFVDLVRSAASASSVNETTN